MTMLCFLRANLVLYSQVILYVPPFSLNLSPKLTRGIRPQRIRLLPSPCRFTLNEVSFAVTGVDVLFHLRKEELFKQAEEADSVLSSAYDTLGSNDSMSNLCRHLLQQRRYV